MPDGTYPKFRENYTRFYKKQQNPKFNWADLPKKITEKQKL